jgi:hypothetical protein
MTNRNPQITTYDEFPGANMNFRISAIIAVLALQTQLFPTHVEKHPKTFCQNNSAACRTKRPAPTARVDIPPPPTTMEHGGLRGGGLLFAWAAGNPGLPGTTAKELL